MLAALFRVAASVAAVPVGALALLVATGELAAGPAFFAAVAVAVAALGLGLVWTRDLAMLAGLMQRAGSGGPLAPPIGPRGAFSFSGTLLDEVVLLSQVVTDRGDEVDRLRRAEESILDRLPDPLIVLGPDRTVRRSNEAARLAFGQEIAAVLRHPELRAAIDRTLAAGGEAPAQVAEIRLPVPVEREVHATVSGLNSIVAGGNGALIVLSDRTRERAVERTRADFVANASHELRTPLASLIGFIATLQGPAADDPPAQKRFLDIMAEQAERMNRLIDDLLSLSRIELSEHQIPADAVDLVDLTERMCAAFEIRLQQRRQELDLSADDNLPPISGDPDQLEQVLQNLLDNAVKYGSEGGLIKVGVEHAQAGGKFPARAGVVLSVSNDGPGISRSHLPRLTERFYRVDAGRSRSIGGTGLGLAIVKHVVNRHRGQLLIESEEGKSTTFSVWLPVG